MSYRLLQQDIHSNFSTNSGVWSNYYDQIFALYTGASSMQDLSDHLMREFNRKVEILGFTNLMFAPYDAGYRFISGFYSGPVVNSNGLFYNGEQLMFNGEEIVI